MARRTKLTASFEQNPYLVELGQRILKRRLALGLHVDGLCRRIGLDANNLILIESGNRNPTILTLNLIAHGLEVDIYRLLPGNSEMGQAEFAARDLREHIDQLLKMETAVRKSMQDLADTAKVFNTIEKLIESDHVSKAAPEPSRARANRRRKAEPPPVGADKP